MAVTLSVVLSDAEQAKLAEIAELISPGSSPQQVKVWAEKACKRGLRRIVRERYMAFLQDGGAADLTAWDSQWSEEA
jgi:hypothetical protein